VAHTEFDMETDLAPERVMGALLDFTDRRPKLWPGLNPKEFRVLRSGDTWAEIREGNGGKIWANERYDWSEPGFVIWRVTASGFSSTDSYVSARFTRRGTGSRIHVTWDRRGTGLFGRFVIWLIGVTGGRPVRASLKRGLAAIATQPASPLPPGASV
jgi:hypothetical protein